MLEIQCSWNTCCLAAVKVWGTAVLYTAGGALLVMAADWLARCKSR